MADKVSGKAFDLKLFRRVLTYVAPYKKIFWGAFSITLLLGALSTTRPILTQRAIDNYILEGDEVGLLNITLLIFAVLVAESIFQFLFTYAANYLGQSIIRDIRMQLFDRITRFKLGFFDKTPIGTLVTRAVSDIETIASIFAEGVLVIFGDLFKIIVMVFAMFWFFDVKLVLISLSVVPVLYIATRWFQKAIKKTFSDVRNEVAALNAFVQEHISGMNVVQMFNREKAEMDKFKVINNRHRKANIRSIWYFSIFLPLIEILSAISIGLAMGYGGWAAINSIDSWTLQQGFYKMMGWDTSQFNDSITIGTLLAFIMFINALYRPLRQLADRFNTLQMGMVASERVLKLLDREEALEPEGKSEVHEVNGRIEFKDVHFAYVPDEPVLRGVSFSVEPGETLAIVGATGAGKSTIISLLMGFYPYQKGSVSLDGTEITDLKLENLRSHFALVLQDVFLFSDSIYNNITLREDIPMEHIVDAAKKIGVDEFVRQLPEEYEYNVKERGQMISAGQRQLLSFLRAYVTNPPILILDEATSSIDSHTEQLIQNATDLITEGRTSIVIAHRLATIQNADKILVMDKGKVVEEGKHDELLAKGGYYARLYEMQFKEREAS
ncbi:ABC transporter ATP-binding protein [Phaeocystidibacter luteus]|uniref:ABC transporter ATP-binding protein n=1 Tax=Phaeocystidibacter luteus TaxID=911197 RepID=A0A6N6RMH3_9FLAO|nr:ABC transporter ATP-binding protein [Phaeocystidibacter luteus]KAB2814797.1 ABC transporter ATP-binding protein [Phaeocystidibacter luteus]